MKNVFLISILCAALLSCSVENNNVTSSVHQQGASPYSPKPGDPSILNEKNTPDFCEFPYYNVYAAKKNELHFSSTQDDRNQYVQTARKVNVVLHRDALGLKNLEELFTLWEDIDKTKLKQRYHKQNLSPGQEAFIQDFYSNSADSDLKVDDTEREKYAKNLYAEYQNYLQNTQELYKVHPSAFSFDITNIIFNGEEFEDEHEPLKTGFCGIKNKEARQIKDAIWRDTYSPWMQLGIGIVAPTITSWGLQKFVKGSPPWSEKAAFAASLATEAGYFARSHQRYRSELEKVNVSQDIAALFGHPQEQTHALTELKRAEDIRKWDAVGVAITVVFAATKPYIGSLVRMARAKGKVFIMNGKVFIKDFLHFKGMTLPIPTAKQIAPVLDKSPHFAKRMVDSLVDILNKLRGNKGIVADAASRVTGQKLRRAKYYKEVYSAIADRVTPEKTTHYLDTMKRYISLAQKNKVDVNALKLIHELFFERKRLFLRYADQLDAEVRALIKHSATTGHKLKPDKALQQVLGAWEEFHGFNHQLVRVPLERFMTNKTDLAEALRNRQLVSLVNTEGSSDDILRIQVNLILRHLDATGLKVKGAEVLQGMANNPKLFELVEQWINHNSVVTRDFIFTIPDLIESALKDTNFNFIWQ